MKHRYTYIFRNALAAAAAILLASACSKEDTGGDGSGTGNPGNGSGKVSITVIPSVLPFGQSGTYGSEENGSLNDVSACIFRNGILEEVFTDMRRTGDGYEISTKEASGNIYIMGNTAYAIDLEQLKEENLSESEWKKTVLPYESETCYTGIADLSSAEGNPLKIKVGLAGNTARLDLDIETEENISVERIVLEGISDEFHLFPTYDAASDAYSGTKDIEIEFGTPLSEDTEGIAFVCEQLSDGVSAEVTVRYGEKTLSRKVPFPDGMKRNTVHVIKVGKDISSSDISVEVVPWEEDGTDAVPDFGSAILIATDGQDFPEGIEISADRKDIVLPYTGTDFTFAVACDEELEAVQDEEYGFTIEKVETGDGSGRSNVFRIRKEMWRIGMPERNVRLQFRRKGLEGIYPDDCIGVKVSANPTVLEGLLDFSESSVHDFGRYADNEFGIISVPEGKTLSVEFSDGEDPWIKAEAAEGKEGVFRIIGGWRPNDPTADGRIQSAKIVISDASDGSGREEYTVIRRNWGLPVTKLNGIWWCKYNAMGNSRDFRDQILSSEDPAVRAGKQLFEYLQDCSAEEYFSLWKWGYQGDSGIGLEVKDIDGLAKFDGFRQDIKVHMNTLDPKALAPDGYELPSYDDFGRIFGNMNGGYIWIMWDGSHISPWNGGTNIQRRNRRKNNVTAGSVVMDDLLFMKMYENGNTEDEPLVFYGASAQWDNSGVKHGHYNNMLFACHSPEKKGWYFIGAMHALYVTTNGAGNNDTRIVRFRKSDVEYIY